METAAHFSDDFSSEEPTRGDIAPLTAVYQNLTNSDYALRRPGQWAALSDAEIKAAFAD